MRKLSNLLVFVSIVFFFTSCSQKTANPLQELSDGGDTFTQYVFYPSTIRMINFSDNEAFYKATKGIELLQFISIDLTSPKNDSIYTAWELSHDFQQWDELLNASVAGNKSVVYAPKDADGILFASMKTTEGVNLIWAEGYVNLSEAMKVMNSGLDLGPITNFLEDKDKEKKRSEIWKKAREEQKILEAADSSLTKQQKD
jgi:hypothetical protein